MLGPPKALDTVSPVTTSGIRGQSAGNLGDDSARCVALLSGGNESATTYRRCKTRGVSDFKRALRGHTQPALTETAEGEEMVQTTTLQDGR